MRQQVRPKGGGDAYSPQRDLAYCYVPAMKEAILALDEENWSGDIRAICRQLQITEEDISCAVGALTRAHIAFISDSSVKTAQQALEDAGWYKAAPGARYLIYGRLGEVMLGGFFLAIRDVRMLGDEVPKSETVADLIAEGLRVAGRTEDYIMSILEPELDPEPNTVNACVQLQFARRALQECQKQREQLKIEHGAVAAQFRTANLLLEHINGLGFWRGICRAILVWWTGKKSQTPISENKN